MKSLRRKAGVLGATFLLLAVFAIQPEHLQAATKVILCTNFPIGNPVQKGLLELKKLIWEKSDGKFELRIIDNGKFGSVSSEMQALQAGAIHLMVESTGSCEPFFPDLSIFDLPYLITNFGPDLAEKLQGPVVTDYLKSLSTKRVDILSVIGCTVRYIFTKKPIHTLEDAKGLKIRTTPSRLHMDIMSALGMMPTPLAWTELYTALQQGVVEGCDPELPSGPAMSFREVAPYWAKFDTSANVALIFANAPWWNKLSDADRAMFMSAIHESGKAIIKSQQKADIRIMEEEKAKGLEVFVPSEEEKAKWIAATANVYKNHPRISGEMVLKLREALSE